MADTSRTKRSASASQRRMSRIQRDREAEIQKLRANLVDLTRIIGRLSSRLDQTIDLVVQLSDKALLKEGASIEGHRPQRGSSDQNKALPAP
jgi:hypothetical protein